MDPCPGGNVMAKSYDSIVGTRSSAGPDRAYSL